MPTTLELLFGRHMPEFDIRQSGNTEREGKKKGKKEKKKLTGEQGQRKSEDR